VKLTVGSIVVDCENCIAYLKVIIIIIIIIIIGVLGGSVHTIKENKETLIVANK
jgi:hypothetical protein